VQEFEGEERDVEEVDKGGYRDPADLAVGNAEGGYL
jgi:hypothetical protein